MANINNGDESIAKRPERTGLLDPKIMDGPKVPVTVNDVFRNHPKLFLTYHVMSTPFDVFNTMGNVIGAGLYGLGLRTIPARIISPALITSSTSSLAVISSTTGLAFGCLGMVLGVGGLSQVIMKGENATPTPYNDEGVQQRVDGLSHNFMVRIIDLSCWSGMGLAATALLVAGGPSKLRLCTGALGVAQALSLGSAVGGLGAFGCLYSLRMKDNFDDE
jgi:hypothetical protein